jgi:Xaa-Pro aminopeptidase
MSPPPPPPPPPLCLPSFTRRGKKKKVDELFDEKSGSTHPSGTGTHTRSSRGSRTRSSLPASQRPSQQGSPLARSASYSPTATITDAQSKVDVTSHAEKLTFSEDTESYNNLPKLAPKLDRSRSKLTRGNTFRSKFGYGWGLGLGRKDKDKEDLFTEVDRSSSQTTILPVYPREAPPSFALDNAQTPTRHMSQRSKASHASKQSQDSQASRATKSSNMSRGSRRSNNSKRPSLTGSGSVNTLVGSALERKEAYQDPIREHIDTSLRLAELRQFMAKDNLDY